MKYRIIIKQGRTIYWTTLSLLFLFCSTWLQGQKQDSSYYWQLHEKGRLQCEASDFYNAKVSLENALLEIKEDNYHDILLEAGIMIDLAWAYSGLRDNTSEHLYLEAALKLYVDNFKLESLEYATALHDMALTQGDRGNLKYAIELLDSSTTVFRKYVPDLYAAGRASNLVSIAWMYREQGDNDKAIAALKEAINLIKTEGGDHFTEMESAHHILGYTYMYNGDLTDALHHLLEAKKLRAKKYGTQHPKFHKTLLKISECYSKLGEYEQAQDYLDTIIKSMHKELDSQSYETIQLDSIRSWHTLLQTYIAKGNNYLNQYGKDQDLNHLKSNLKWFKKAIDVMQKIIFYYPSKEGRFQMIKDFSFLFDHSINQAVILYNNYHDQQYLDIAFQVSELSRGFSFLETLHKSQITEFSGLPQNLLNKESALNIKMQKFELGNQNELPDSQSWVELNLELQKVQQKIKKQFPDYFDLKSNLFVPTLKEIQQKLNSQTAIVEYFEGSRNVFTFVITDDSVAVHSLDIPQDYNLILSNMIDIISHNPITSNQSIKSLNEDSRLIYKWLIAPIHDLIHSKQRIVIIPDKKLNYVPFEALISGESDDTNLTYLIHEHAVAYDYSCTSLFAKQEIKYNPSYQYHGFAPGIRDDTFHDESLDEIKSAHNIFGGQYSIDKNANRQNLLTSLKDANIVHIAAHSILDETDISKFSIVLNDDKNNNKKDSFRIEDIYLADINSDLIILSGCQTADGVLKEGEGLLSLSNAFKYAGANSLTCSLWETENYVSNKIITDYIQNLDKGALKDDALRSAKINFINSADPLLKHPFYWSTFVNIGNQNPIPKLHSSNSSPNPKYAILLIVFMLTFSILFFSKRNKLK